MIAFYDEQIEFSLLFTYKPHTSVVEAQACSCCAAHLSFSKNQWGSFSCYAARLSFSKNQWGSFSCYAAHLNFSKNQWGSLLFIIVKIFKLNLFIIFTIVSLQKIWTQFIWISFTISLWTW